MIRKKGKIQQTVIKAGFFITSQIEFSSKYRSKILAQTVGMRRSP